MVRKKASPRTRWFSSSARLSAVTIPSGTEKSA